MRSLAYYAARIPLRIQTKLLLAFMVIVALLVLGGSLALLALRASSQRAEALLDLHAKVAAYQQLQQAATTQLYRISFALAAPGPENLADIPRQLEQFRYDFERLRFVANEELRIHARLAASREEFVDVVEQVSALLRAGEARASKRLQGEQLGPAAARLDRDVHALISLAQAEMIESAERNHTAYLGTQRMVLGFAVASMGLALALGLALSGSLLVPVRTMARQVRAVASGDFSLRSSVSNRDELGTFALDLNRMNDELLRLHKERETHVRLLRQTFGRYSSAEIVDALIDSPEGLNLGGSKRKVSLLMSDLRGFTSMTDTLPAEQIVRLLNAYLGAMTEIILRHKGTIDEFLGDGILVIFGAPEPSLDHAERAVACAVEMQQRMPPLNAEHRELGLPELQMGIGIHTGEVVVGNLGSLQRAKYGVVGRAVNVVSRIESCTVGAQVLISEATRRELDAGLVTGFSQPIEFKGLREPIQVHEVRAYGARSLISSGRPRGSCWRLREPLSVRCVLVNGKRLGELCLDGTLLTLSSAGAELCVALELTPHQNLKLSVSPPQTQDLYIYAKVLERTGPDRIYVCFTDVSPSAARWLAGLPLHDTQSSWPALDVGDRRSWTTEEPTSETKSIVASG